MQDGVSRFALRAVVIPFWNLPSASPAEISHSIPVSAYSPAMELPVQSASPSPSFAGVLASLAAPASRSRSPWNDDALADDVAVLSYESALRAHARYRPADEPPVAPLPPAKSLAEAPQVPSEPVPAGSPEAHPISGRPFQPVELKLKTASVTIRMSEAERDQLLRRAGEAGMTVSAYLRSCTFEAESLRAMVKQTLAQLRSAKAALETSAAPQPSPGIRVPAPGPLSAPFLRLLHWFAPWRRKQTLPCAS